jgi:hypothetical protein
VLEKNYDLKTEVTKYKPVVIADNGYRCLQVSVTDTNGKREIDIDQKYKDSFAIMGYRGITLDIKAAKALLDFLRHVVDE